MAPTCVKCGNARFKLEEFEPVGAEFKYFGVCCTQCHGLAGVVEYFNTGFLLRKLAKALKINL